MHPLFKALWFGGLAALTLASTALAAPRAVSQSEPAAEVFEREARPDADVTIKRVTWRWIPERSFKRISEYLGGDENKGGRVIERTDPNRREGFYFIVSLHWKPGSLVLMGSTIDIEYVRTSLAEPAKKTFLIPDSAGTFPEIFLGLTEPEWADPQAAVTAWKVTLKDPLGNVIDSAQSFLWAIPEPANAAAAAPAAK